MVTLVVHPLLEYDASVVALYLQYVTIVLADDRSFRELISPPGDYVVEKLDE